MLVYRIAREEYIRDFSGAGAKAFGGRWNRPGMAVLYTSQARSLALLELLVHFSAFKVLKLAYCYAVLDVPDKQIVHLDPEYLPDYVLQYNHSKLFSITEHYFVKEDTLALRVPSVLVPGEYNYLLNPEHTQFKSIQCVSIENTVIDERFKALMHSSQTK